MQSHIYVSALAHINRTAFSIIINSDLTLSSMCISFYIIIIASLIIYCYQCLSHSIFKKRSKSLCRKNLGERVSSRMRRLSTRFWQERKRKIVPPKSNTASDLNDTVPKRCNNGNIEDRKTYSATPSNNAHINVTFQADEVEDKRNVYPPPNPLDDPPKPSYLNMSDVRSGSSEEQTRNQVYMDMTASQKIQQRTQQQGVSDPPVRPTQAYETMEISHATSKASANKQHRPPPANEVNVVQSAKTASNPILKDGEIDVSLSTPVNDSDSVNNKDYINVAYDTPLPLPEDVSSDSDNSEVYVNIQYDTPLPTDSDNLDNDER